MEASAAAHRPRNIRARMGGVPLSKVTRVTYAHLHPADNWDWLREVTPLSKLERPA